MLIVTVSGWMRPCAAACSAAATVSLERMSGVGPARSSSAMARTAEGRSASWVVLNAHRHGVGVDEAVRGGVFGGGDGVAGEDERGGSGAQFLGDGADG